MLSTAKETAANLYQTAATQTSAASEGTKNAISRGNAKFSTMPGMIYNAHSLLTTALDSRTNGIPKDLFASGDLKGIMMLSSVTAGFLWAGCVGSGILLAKKGSGNEWSAPCAMGLGGSTFGFLAGASYKNVIVFIFDDDSLAALTGEVGLRGGGLLELTVGPFGRHANFDLNLSNRGAGGTVSIAYTKGAFGCLGVDFGLAAPRNSVNTEFYKQDLSATEILKEESAALIPEDSDTLIELVYEKLGLLMEGKTYVPNEEEKERVEQALVKIEEDEKAGGAEKLEEEKKNEK